MRTALGVLAGLLVVAVSAPAHAQLLHHFDLDEESGLVASDRNCGGGGALLGFENDDDAQWVEGQFGGALDLGADLSLDNRVAVDLQATDGGEAGFTVAMWINPGEQINNLGEFQLLATPGDTVGFTIMNNTFGGVVRQ